MPVNAGSDRCLRLEQHDYSNQVAFTQREEPSALVGIFVVSVDCLLSAVASRWLLAKCGESLR